jgi:hypothetical protein
MKKTTIDITEELLNLDVNDPKYHQKRMKLMVKYLQRYMKTYDDQVGYENYTDFTLIEDVLYGLGVALNPKEHQFSTGFDVWKMKLIEHIQHTSK